MSRTNP